MANTTTRNTAKKITVKKQGNTSTVSRNGSPKKTNETKERTLKQVFEKELKVAYNIEKQMMKTLPSMAKAASNEELQDACLEHLEETKRHVERLEKIFDYLRIDRNTETSEIMDGLVMEGKKAISDFEKGPVRDAAIIISLQKIEHYEIAAYGSACELSDVLGYGKITDTLNRTLEEEKSTDHMLTDIAKDVNDEAVEMSEKREFESMEM